MNIYNENFDDFFGQGEGTFRSFYSNYKKLSYIPNLYSDAFVPPPPQLSEPSSSLAEPLVEYRAKRIGSLDVGDVALIIAGIIIIAFLVYYFWNRWKDKKEKENKPITAYNF